ncbi:16S rRNA (cytosine(1402)-N(4))-methyltransferase RsmH [Spiroplasma endosymbiont of Labia minor]|uniref:16S rRNA (cytosine(1402)-N(4))-methyltransferase RsmH n=1 Tax=Spiroplasma endosymbiont of Labia minor TaxID=3066305 RepID=UPI0030D0C92C
MNEHFSVLLQESINSLNIKADGIYVDTTLGRGGHSSEILKKISNGMLYAIDQDEQAIKLSRAKLNKINSNYKLIWGNFRQLKFLLALEGIFKVDGILMDLGISSPQLDQANRGFSYRFDGPLDMRMDQKQTLTASIIVNTYPVDKIIRIFRQYGEEKFSLQIARQIEKYRKTNEINTTLKLVEIIKKSLPQKILKQSKHPAKKIFQALRIYVNDELSALKDGLQQAAELLNTNGRLVVITFHSLEEKIVKDFFRSLTISELDKIERNLPIRLNVKHDFKLITKRGILPTNEEVQKNNRSHSAKLWILERT